MFPTCYNRSMKEQKCEKCGKVVSYQSKGLCRACYRKSLTKLPRDRDLLYKLYWEDGLTLQQIGDKFGFNGVKTPDAVSKVFRKLGIPRRNRSEQQTGHLNHSWKGGRITNGQGYILVKAYDHPRAHRGYVFEHILVWERANKMPVPKGWQVHHKGTRYPVGSRENKSDNRPENLEAMPARRHAIANLYSTIQTIKDLEVEIARLKGENDYLQEQLKCSQTLALDI